MRKQINYLVMLLTCIAFLVATTAGAQEWSKDQKEVWQTVEEGWSAWKAGDADEAFKNVHEKFLGWNSTEPLPIDKAQWVDMYNMYKESMSVEYYSLNPARILVEGNTAIVYYYFKVYMVYAKGDKKKEMERMGRNVEFYVKDGGDWMLLGDMTAYEEKDD
jgi:hypothetical protein